VTFEQVVGYLGCDTGSLNRYLNGRRLSLDRTNALEQFLGFGAETSAALLGAFDEDTKDVPVVPTDLSPVPMARTVEKGQLSTADSEPRPPI
jgi:hypothetical protein